MNFIIGFGSTEKNLEDAIEREITEWIFDLYSSSDDKYFTDDLAKSVHNHIDKIAIESREESEKHKDATDYPSRYSSFYHTVLHDCNYMAIILRFSHINRRHAMSPDGWAMMQNQRVFIIEEWEAGRKRRSAA